MINAYSDVPRPAKIIRKLLAEANRRSTSQSLRLASLLPSSHYTARSTLLARLFWGI